MKKVFLVIALMGAWVCSYAQESEAQKAAREAAEAMEKAAQEQVQQAAVSTPATPSNWKKSIQFDLGLNQTALLNWAAGGNNTASVRTALDAKFDYKKDLSTWNNRLQLEYGFLYSSDKPWPFIQKNADRIYLESKWAHSTNKHSIWKYTAGFDFRSQFTTGYDYGTPPVADPTIEDWKAARVLKSDFLSPAYTNLALGIEWIPTTWLDINLAPLTGGFTIVNNPDLRKEYSMDLRKGIEVPMSGYDYNAFKFQFGAQLKVDVKFNVNKKFNFESQLVLFTDYLHEPYIRINWDNKIEWQLSRLFKLGLYTWTIYDPWVLKEDGAPRGWQFKESVALNFSYTLKPGSRRHRHPIDKSK